MALAEGTAIICCCTRSMSTINLMEFCCFLLERHIIFAWHKAQAKKIYRKYDRQKSHITKVENIFCTRIAFDT